jgi:hypothetical protein
VNQRLEPLLLEEAVQVRDVGRKVIVEDDAPYGRDQTVVRDGLLGRAGDVLPIFRGERRQVDETSGVAEDDARQRFDLAGLVGDQNLVRRTERPSLAFRARPLLREVVAA